MCETKFNKSFDELVELYQSDPVAFDEYRRQALENQITKICADCPEKEDRCRRFVWRMEQDLAKFKDPIARYNKMVEMFWDQVNKLQKASQFAIDTNTPEIVQSADILQFRRK